MGSDMAVVTPVGGGCDEESEARWRSLVENIPDVVFTVDKDGTILFINSPPAGLTAEDAIGTNVLDYVTPEYREMVSQSIKRVFQTGESDSYEITARSPDDTTVWYSTHLGPIKHNDEVVSVILVRRDITNRKKTEEALRESREKYSTLVKEGNDGIIIIQDGLFQFMNSKMLEMTGYSLEEAIGKPFIDFVSPGYKEQVAKRYKERMAGVDTPSKYEIGILSKDHDKSIPVELNVSVIEYKGRPATMAIVRDITRRKQWEEALRKSEEMFRTLAEQSPNMIFINHKGRVAFANEKCMEAMGYTQKEFYSEDFDFMCLIAPEDMENVRAIFEKHMKGEDVEPYDYGLITKDGQKIDVIITTKLIDYHGGRAILGIITDITERKTAELELKEYSKKLEEANALKDLFTDIMRHDLLNPAGVVGSFAEILLGRENDPEMRRILKTMRRETDRLIEMIENASRFAKLESTDEIERKAKNLGEIIENAIQNFEFQLAENNIKVVFPSGGNYPCWVNSLMIEDIFSNLISNAIKYSPEDTTIEIDIQNGGDEWVTHVKDQGDGVTDENKEKLFTRFERLGKEGVKGTGLGLAIAKRIVDLHGGNIWIEDNPEGGSIFCVSLPKDGNRT